MPRAHLVLSHGQDAPLTVTAVSLKLGVSPSTLRTWERRYGLGPGERQAGSHRRYLPEDVLRLSHMVELIHAGVTPADAARTVLADHGSLKEEIPAPNCCNDLVCAAENGDEEKLTHLIEAAVAEHGLVHTWSRFIEPALATIRSNPAGETPGLAPSALLTCAALNVLRAISTQRPEPGLPESPAVLILADHEHNLAAHVIGVALQWHGSRATVIATPSGRGAGFDQRLTEFLTTTPHPVALVIILGRGAACEKLVTYALEKQGLDVILVGNDTPALHDAHLQRVRTPAACVEEALAFLSASPHRTVDA